MNCLDSDTFHSTSERRYTVHKLLRRACGEQQHVGTRQNMQPGRAHDAACGLEGTGILGLICMGWRPDGRLTAAAHPCVSSDVYMRGSPT